MNVEVPCDPEEGEVRKNADEIAEGVGDDEAIMLQIHEETMAIIKQNLPTVEAREVSPRIVEVE